MIQVAKPDDLPEIYELMKAMHGEGSFAALTLHPLKMAGRMVDFIQSDDTCVFVDRKDTGIAGVMVGGVYAPWFSDDLVGYEMILYVTPANRGNSSALRLVKAWRDWCVMKGVKQLRPAVSTGVDTDFYDRLGFLPQGNTYLMGV